MSVECIYGKSARKKDVDNLPNLAAIARKRRSTLFNAKAIDVANRNTAILLARRENC